MRLRAQDAALTVEKLADLTDSELRKILMPSRTRKSGCLPPDLEDAEAVRPYFAALRGLRDETRSRSVLALPHLSMGMSHDFEVALAEGATLIRVGTDIFGPRQQG